MSPVAHWEFEQLKADLFGTQNNPQRGRLVRIEEKLDVVLSRRQGLMSNLEKMAWSIGAVVITAIVLALLHIANPALP